VALAVNLTYHVNAASLSQAICLTCFLNARQSDAQISAIYCLLFSARWLVYLFLAIR